MEPREGSDQRGFWLSIGMFAQVSKEGGSALVDGMRALSTGCVPTAFFTQPGSARERAHARARCTVRCWHANSRHCDGSDDSALPNANKHAKCRAVLTTGCAARLGDGREPAKYWFPAVWPDMSDSSGIDSAVQTVLKPMKSHRMGWQKGEDERAFLILVRELRFSFAVP
eukprot:3103322-Rhodomonas_salina.1